MKAFNKASGFNANGILLTDWQTVNGKLYCFNPTNGKALTGWTTKDSSKIYLNADGTAASGVTVIGDKTYYFDPSTFAMRTGWITIGDSSSYFDPTTGVLTETGHAPVQLNVVDYKQFDSKWSNKVINYSTIGKVGCVTTALAMKYSYQTNTNTTPDKMVSKLTYSSDNLIWSSCTKLGYTVDNASGTISQSVMQKIYDKLLSNKPVVIGAKKSNGSQHYVLVTGYTGSKGTTFSAENFIINDTTIGHWEIAGVVSPEPLPTCPDGFPQEVLAEFEKQTGRGVLCNKTYSGTDVIRDYGEEQLKTGKWIVYTSADSVFQVAAHEDLIPLEELYDIWLLKSSHWSAISCSFRAISFCLAVISCSLTPMLFCTSEIWLLRTLIWLWSTETFSFSSDSRALAAASFFLASFSSVLCCLMDAEILSSLFCSELMLVAALAG